VVPLVAYDKVDLRRPAPSYLSRSIDKVSSLTPRINVTERLLSFRCEPGTYHAILLACPQGAHKVDCWVDMREYGWREGLP
jgi:hypothetical protein